MTKSSAILSEQDLGELVTKINEFDYIRFSWSDIHGIARGVTAPARAAAQFLRKGFPGAAGIIAFGTGTDQIKEIFLHIEKEHGGDSCDFIPAVPRLYSLPWVHKTKRTAELICEALWQDGSTFTSLPRFITRNQMEKLSSMGFKFYLAFESEFTALKADTLEPLSAGCNYAVHRRTDDHSDWLYDAEGLLEQSGIQVRTFHAEFAPGQWEITFIPKFGMDTLDDMYVYKQAMKTIAKNHGHVVTFMPKHSKEGSISGLHLNFSLWTEDGKNAFYDSSKPDNLSDTCRYWLGGMLKHLRGMTALSCPTINCYRRLHRMFVPSQADWGIDIRMVALRIISYSEEATRIEHRLPSSACNPYLATAAVIAAGIDGIENKIEPPAQGPRSDAEKLPCTLAEALTAIEEDDVIVGALDKEFMSWFLTIKRKIEIKKFGDHDMKKFVKEEIEAEREYYLETI